MALTPELEEGEVLLGTDYETTIYPSYSYHMKIEEGRIQGMTDNLESMKQVVFCILNTERSEYLAYSPNYGVELLELIGKPTSYVLPELERRITEALTWDSRIESVDGFEFEINHSKVHVTFTVHTIYGDLREERTVDM